MRSALWLLGISAGAALPEDLPYQGDATIYDSAGATGAIGSGTVQTGDTIYDNSGATGSVSGATILPPEAQR